MPYTIKIKHHPLKAAKLKQKGGKKVGLKIEEQSSKHKSLYFQLLVLMFLRITKKICFNVDDI